VLLVVFVLVAILASSCRAQGRYEAYTTKTKGHRPQPQEAVKTDEAGYPIYDPVRYKIDVDRPQPQEAVKTDEAGYPIYDPVRYRIDMNGKKDPVTRMCLPTPGKAVETDEVGYPIGNTGGYLRYFYGTEDSITKGGVRSTPISHVLETMEYYLSSAHYWNGFAITLALFLYTVLDMIAALSGTGLHWMEGGIGCLLWILVSFVFPEVLFALVVERFYLARGVLKDLRAPQKDQESSSSVC